jgi:hypothetical protein
MLFKGNSSRLELLIEKIQANKENHVSEQDIKGTRICHNCISVRLIISYLVLTGRFNEVDSSVTERRFLIDALLYTCSVFQGVLPI